VGSGIEYQVAGSVLIANDRNPTIADVQDIEVRVEQTSAFGKT
jgi:hypothetical protein